LLDIRRLQMRFRLISSRHEWHGKAAEEARSQYLIFGEVQNRCSDG
jgi:hypothetical protein